VFHGKQLGLGRSNDTNSDNDTVNRPHSMKRVNIQLSTKAHTQAKILAVLQEKTLNDYLAAAIEKQIKKDEGLLKQLSK